MEAGAADLNNLPLRTKAALGSGRSFWHTKAVDGLPAVMLTDGPHGVRAQSNAADHLGFADSAPATCFPPAAGLAQSWDRRLVERVGAALADEARSLGVNVLLGPGVNIKRDPRCGRNFEYYSEDPLLSGMLGASWVTGLQRRGVGASVKHFAANNTEHDRMRSDSLVDARALREIYLKSFQRVVTEARPWTVMCSYNKINGVYASQNRWLLTEVLRHQWDFTGVVVSDWGAVDDRVAAVAAGLDLAMPGGDPTLDEQVVAAVEAGDLDETAVTEAAGRVMDLLRRAAAGAGPVDAVDPDAHHGLAREAARRSIALLKNAGALLPLAPERKLAVIGPFATAPHYQGGGSSRINAARLDIPLEQIRRHATVEVTYAPGFGVGAAPAPARADAVAAACAADVAVVFLGLSDADESEGFDRENIELPDEQVQLLAAVAEAQPHTVAVLSHGGVVRLADVDRLAAAVLDGGLLGQGGGAAVADVLFGIVNPSGRLAETVPVRLEDAPSFLNFPGEHSHVRYGEGIHVGYRWYDARAIGVTYPFGHGLSYTTFDYGSADARVDGDAVLVTVPVTNAGSRDGREVVQVYVSKPASDVQRPPRELKGFEVVDLARGATSTVAVRIALEDLAYWDDRVDDWIVEGGDYVFGIGSSSRDIRCTTHVRLDGDRPRITLTENSTIAEVLAHPVAGPLFAAMVQQAVPGTSDVMSDHTGLLKMAGSIPLNRLPHFTGGADRSAIDQLVHQANSHPEM